MNSQLHQIADLIKSRQFDQARQALEHYLEQRPEDSWGWYLRSFVEPGRNKKIAAAQHALTLAPGHVQFQTRLAKLQAMPPQPAHRWRLLVVFGVAVMAIIAVGALVLRNGAQSSDAPLPTLAVLDTAVAGAIPTETASEMGNTTEEQSSSATPVELPASAEPMVTVEGETPVSSPSPDLPQINVNEATSTTVDQNVATPVVTETASANLPSGNSTPTLPLRPTRVGSTTLTPAASPTPAPVVATPAFGSITESGVPVNTAINIGIGEMRVVEITRPAEQRIAELGGSVPNVPSDQAWVLVEALLICTDDRNCIPNPSALWIVGSSGTGYSPSPQLNLPPSFGSFLSNRQVWGYLGFVVPKSESSLRLVLVQAGQTFVFALQ